MDRGLTIALLALAGSPLGCARQDWPSMREQTPSSLHAERYADLPGLRSSPHSGLKAELALLAEEGATPQALDAQFALQRSPAGGDASAGRRLIDESIPAISRPLLTAQLEEVYTGGPLRLSPVQLERGREVLLRCSQERQRFREALQACHAGLGLPLSDGILVDLTFLDAIRLGARLEAVAAADALAENEPDAALGSLAILFEAARILGRERNIATRTTAANLREDALHVLQAVAAHERATPETHSQLLGMLERATAEWPSDQTAWIGDRAAGLIAYELVRDGHYFSLLDQHEIQKLRERGLLAATAKAVMRNIDTDELFYLHAMRRIIESCQRPYFERMAVLNVVRSELTALEQTGDYPLIAGKLLLTDFEAGHRLQAEDLARTMAWKVALQVASDNKSIAAPINPVTGKPLHVLLTARGVEISDILDRANGPIVVPTRAQVKHVRGSGPLRR
jgi:hypothetical protein